MAKDRRNKVRPTMDLESDADNGFRSGARPSPRMTDRSSRRKEASERRRVSEQSEESARPTRRRKKKLSRAALIIRWVIVVFVVVFLVFAGILANYIYKAMFIESGEKVPPIEPTQYDVTPVENANKVAYYLVGILGEGETDDTMMLSVICHDKKQNTASILQLPQATRIAMEAQWEVDTLGKVFANPKALDWCEVCRKRLYEPEINEGDVATHIACGTEVTLKKGSAVSGLVDFVNDQLGLPVDHFFLLPKQSVSLFVDAVGGVDVNLTDYYQLGGNDYEPGVHTLTGDAAMEYITYTDGTLERDVVRMLRQREVLGALLTRLFRMEDEMVTEIIEEDIMDSSYAIRTDCEDSEIVAVLQSLAKVGVTGMSVQILPGEAADSTAFSVHKDELLTVLNADFNPYSSAINSSDLLIPELTDSTASQTYKDALSNAVVDQTGKLLDTDTE